MENIDPDGTPYSRFINDVVGQILNTPLPPEAGEPNSQQHGNFVLGALAAINAGIISNLLEDPADSMSSMMVVGQLANETMQEIGLIKEQMGAGRVRQ